MRLLEGAVVEDANESSDALVADLREQIRDVRAELSAARHELNTSKREAARATAELRRQLSPLYRALQAIFGELDALGDNESGPAADSRVTKVWDSWKAKLPGQTAKIIDVLLLHGEMNSTQIAISIGIHRNNVPPLIHKLNKAGLISKNGHNYSLKQL